LPEREIALDNLLLTQGWIGYDGSSYLPRPQTGIEAEGIKVTGHHKQPFK